MHKRLVLASKSPRRRDLLRMIGLDFTVRPAGIAEPPLDGPVSGQVESLARAKACAVAAELSAGVVLGADTVVVLDGRVLGKPADTAAARAMLESLQGREHRVYTGVALVDAATGRQAVAYEETRVRFRTLDKPVIDWYLQTGEPMDKAGAYGIQGRGSVLIAGVYGCYFNVVGLPVGPVVRMLADFGIDVFAIGNREAGDDKG